MTDDDRKLLQKINQAAEMIAPWIDPDVTITKFETPEQVQQVMRKLVAMAKREKEELN